MMPARFTWTSAAVAGAFALCIAAGCSSDTTASPAKPGKPKAIGPSDFRGGQPSPGYAAQPRPAPSRGPHAPPARGFEDVVALVGTPAPLIAAVPEPPPPPPTAGQPAVAPGSTQSSSAPAPTRTPPRQSPAIVVDELVGQINGKPVYASDFFSDMDARLRAQAAIMPRREWERMLVEDVSKSLNAKLMDELLLAEFQGSLNPQARVGLLAFVEALRGEILSQNRGSETTAEERLLSETGRSLEEEVRYKADQTLIAEQLRRSVVSKVYVSSRDIKRFYEQNPQLFAAASKAVFRIVQIPRSDEQRRAAVQRAVDAGEPFIDIAAAYSDFKKADRGLYERDIGAKGLAATEIFAAPALNAPAQKLREGQSAGPIEFDGSLYWIHLEELISTPGMTLYEAQLGIERVIRGQRLDEAQRRYFEQLLQRANVSDRRQMIERLIRFGMTRYLGPAAESARG